MLNQCILVGKVVEITSHEDNTELIIDIDNPKGDIDTIPVVVDDKLIHAMEYVKVGTTIGIKARIKCDEHVSVIAEKLTFINTKKEE